MNQLLTTKALECLINKKFSDAVDIYNILSEKIGEKFYRANLIYCKKRLEGNNNKNNEKSVERILIFTNLGLSTIDGSTVFIANTINLFCSIAKEVHLLCTVLPGENFSARITSKKNLSIFQSDSKSTINKINELNSRYAYTQIFVRAFGEKSIWFDASYAEKVILYWTLLPKFNEMDLVYYNSVDAIAFQTEELRDYTITQLGPKKNLLIPPLLQSSHANAGESLKIINKGKVVVSYVGTLRPECFSIELLSAMIKILRQRKDTAFYLLISKIFYKNPEDKKHITSLINQLATFESVVIEQQASPDRCDFVLQQSDVGFSLWAPTPENIRQISTKLLENLDHGVKTICFKTDVYEKLLGESYEFFIDNFLDLNSAINLAINKSKNAKERYKNSYLLSNFHLSAHKCRLLSYFKGPNRSQEKEDCSFFNEQFDRIYGLYINDSERRRLEALKKNNDIDIFFFKGINGKETLEEEYNSYLKIPFITEWEKSAKKKRLTIGAMGHLHSFIKIAEDALENSYNKILILEADVQIHKNAFLLNSLHRPENFKVMYYGAGVWNNNIKHVSEHLYTPNGTTGTFAIALDNSVLHECIAEWRKFLEPTDIALQKITDKYLEKSFVFTPNLFIADVARSNTTTHRSQKDLSEKFGWILEDYNVSSVEPIDRYVKKIRFVFDHKLNEGKINIIKKHHGDCASLPIDELEFTLEINDHVVEIEISGAFLRHYECIDD